MDQDTRDRIAAVLTEMRQGFDGTHSRLDTVNGRVRKMEIAVAVVQFGFYTIGGALAVAGMQVLVSKLSGQ